MSGQRDSPDEEFRRYLSKDAPLHPSIQVIPSTATAATNATALSTATIFMDGSHYFTGNATPADTVSRCMITNGGCCNITVPSQHKAPPGTSETPKQFKVMPLDMSDIFEMIMKSSEYRNESSLRLNAHETDLDKIFANNSVLNDRSGSAVMSRVPGAPGALGSGPQIYALHEVTAYPRGDDFTPREWNMKKNKSKSRTPSRKRRKKRQNNEQFNTSRKRSKRGRRRSRKSRAKSKRKPKRTRSVSRRPSTMSRTKSRKPRSKTKSRKKRSKTKSRKTRSKAKSRKTRSKSGRKPSRSASPKSKITIRNLYIESIPPQRPLSPPTKPFEPYYPWAADGCPACINDVLCSPCVPPPPSGFSACHIPICRCEICRMKTILITPGMCTTRKKAWSNEYAVIPKPVVQCVDPCKDLDPVLYPRSQNPCIRDSRGNPLTDCIGRPLRDGKGQPILQFSPNGTIMENQFRGNCLGVQPPVCARCIYTPQRCNPCCTHLMLDRHGCGII